MKVSVAEVAEMETVLAYRRSSPLVMWHLLSLDAPTVAVVWTMFVARVTRTAVPWAAYVAMGLAVWVLYAADRLLDTRGLDPLGDAEEFEARHFFHHRYRTVFLVGIVVAVVGLAVLLPRLAAESIHLYLTEGALMAGYFILIHATPADGKIAVPKEWMVGPFFAAATFIPTVARAPWLRMRLLPDAALFAGLCCLNCLFIYKWEHARGERDAHWSTAFGVRLVSWLAVGLVVAAVLVGVRGGWVYAVAVGVSGVGLMGLDTVRGRMGRPALRAAADAVLLTPLLFLGWWR